MLLTQSKFSGRDRSKHVTALKKSQRQGKFNISQWHCHSWASASRPMPPASIFRRLSSQSDQSALPSFGIAKFHWKLKDKTILTTQMQPVLNFPVTHLADAEFLCEVYYTCSLFLCIVLNVILTLLCFIYSTALVFHTVWEDGRIEQKLLQCLHWQSVFYSLIQKFD